MAFKSGLFTSTTGTVDGNGMFIGNKALTSARFAARFYHIYGDGISLKPTSAFYVTPKTGLTVTVSAGWGIMSGYDFEEDADYDITMTSSTSEQTLYIGVRLNVAAGEYTDNHVAARTTFVAATDRVFAIVVIPANAVMLTSAMITDTRTNTTYCGTIDSQRLALTDIYNEYRDALIVLANTGIPLHKTSHFTGGSDAIAPADIGAAPNGTYGVAPLNSGSVVNPAYDYVPINEQTNDYSAALTDIGKDIWITNAAAKALVIDPQNTKTWPANAYFFVTRGGAGAVTITAGSGVTINAPGSRLKIAEQFGTVMLRRTAENVWLLTGSTSA